jgi:hypothetical protein
MTRSRGHLQAVALGGQSKITQSKIENPLTFAKSTAAVSICQAEDRFGVPCQIAGQFAQLFTAGEEQPGGVSQFFGRPHGFGIFSHCAVRGDLLPGCLKVRQICRN